LFKNLLFVRKKSGKRNRGGVFGGGGGGGGWGGREGSLFFFAPSWVKGKVRVNVIVLDRFMTGY